MVDTLDHHIGLEKLATQIIDPNSPIHVKWVSLTGQEQPFVTDQLSYELFSVEYNTVLKVVNGQRVWRSEEKLSKVKSESILNDNSYEGAIEIKCPSSGYYRLAVKDSKTTSTTHAGIKSFILF